MSGTLAPYFEQQWFDNNGDPAASYQLFIYTAGTSTKATSYSDAALTTANANPIILDSAGRCTIFLDAGSYKFVLATDTDTDPPASPIKTVDNVVQIPGSTSSTDVTGTAGEALTAGDCVYLSDGSGGTAGRWYKADSTFRYSSDNAEAIGFATAAIASGSSGTIRRTGQVTGLSGLTAGAVYYVDGTAGAITTSPGSNKRVVGAADSTTTLQMSDYRQEQDQSIYLYTKGQGLGPTVGATEETAFTLSIQADTLYRDNMAVRCTFSVETAATANAKKVKVYYGTTSAYVMNDALNLAASGLFTFTIYRTGASAQDVFASGTVSDSAGAGKAYGLVRTAGTDDNSAAATLKVTIQGGAAGDLAVYRYSVEIVGP